MQLFKTLLAGATLVASAAAAGQGRLRFTSFKPSVEVGDPVTVTWAGGQEAPVTIKLRKGGSNNLQDVAVLTSSGTGGSYTWVPETSLEEAKNYALEISQGDDVNYTGQFAIQGGSADSPPADSPPADSPTTDSPTTGTSRPTDIIVTSTTGTATAAPSTVTATVTSSSSVTPSSSPTPSTSTPSSSLVTSKSTSSSAATPSDDDSNTQTVHPSDTVTASGTGTAPTTAPTGGAASLSSPFALALGIVAAVAYFN